MTVIARLLHQREMTICKLASLSGVGRSQLNSMLTGERDGMNSWKHVDPFLLPAERDVLRGTTKYKEWEARRAGKAAANPAQAAEVTYAS